MYVGDLLSEQVPDLDPVRGTLEIVAIARRPGVLAKVAVRTRSHAAFSPGQQPRPPAGSPLGKLPDTRQSIGADHLARVRDLLDGERIHVVTWQRWASAYIADALGLGEIPPVLLLPSIGHARVLLGEIDVHGIAGWRGLNTLLASALTGWRIWLEPVAATASWRRLHTAMLSRRTITASVVDPSALGATMGQPSSPRRGPMWGSSSDTRQGALRSAVRVEILGLYALLTRPTGSASPAPGQDLDVRVTRMDPDEGRIFVSDRLAATGQLTLL